MDEQRRYFYTDGPSPLHDARESFFVKRREQAEKIEELQKEVGAKAAFHSHGRVVGFDFNKPPGKDWKSCGFSKGYMPKRNTATGKELYRRIQSLAYADILSVLPDKLRIMQLNGRYMSQTSIGWYGERIFVTIPSGGSGDKFPRIPDYLTECKRWEMEKYADERANGACE